MKDLAIRLAALDPDASAALRVIARFDELCGARAGLPTLVREVARLTGCPARLVDGERRLSVRVGPDGAAQPLGEPAAPDWPCVSLPGEGGARLWLECPGPAGPVAAVVLERAAVAAAAVLRRTRGTPVLSVSDDPACVDLVIDATAPLADRLRAAGLLGLAPSALARAVAVHGAPPYVEPVPASSVPPASSVLPAPYLDQRAGIGPAVPVSDLPSSWAGARTALRFTAEGTSADPGPRTVAFDDLGGLALLATVVGPDTTPVPDVDAVTTVAETAPGALATLAAVAESGSLRAAAGALRLHHSTLQDRLAVIERQLGWSVRNPHGRLRLQLALALRRLHRYPDR